MKNEYNAIPWAGLDVAKNSFDASLYSVGFNTSTLWVDFFTIDVIL